MVYWLGKLYRDYKIKTINSATVDYLCYAFHFPRPICKIMALLCMVFLFSGITSHIINLIYVIAFKLKINFMSSQNFKFYGEMNLIHYKLTDENVDKTIYMLVYRLFFLCVFLIVNFSLLMATNKRNIKSIVIWLLAHTTHMFYTLSFNIWIGIYTHTIPIILISIFNTTLYLMFIFMVTLFWLNERYSACQHYRVAIKMI
ncbi:uncharacterized protein LOC114123602 [Aphis gossypii]|uniref:uncharacterized protein LOC114123602 n=1 Tax=Aphis gossypii TaxID=80765 RepID=UPI002158E4F5|nr:uncharacterized protein LOC114123602 [Aphis gossypii]